MNAPFIYLFKTYRGQYIYDVNTNRILSIPRTLWDELNKKEKSPSFEYSEYAKKQILELQQQGYLSSNRWKNIRHPASDIMPFQLDNALCSIVLQVTQICNLNCSYCPFAQGNYYSRKHTGKQMSKETAAYAIDFLVQHATNSNLLAVGFYGGHRARRTVERLVPCAAPETEPVEAQRQAVALEKTGALVARNAQHLVARMEPVFTVKS